MTAACILLAAALAAVLYRARVVVRRERARTAAALIRAADAEARAAAQCEACPIRAELEAARAGHHAANERVRRMAAATRPTLAALTP